MIKKNNFKKKIDQGEKTSDRDKEVFKTFKWWKQVKHANCQVKYWSWSFINMDYRLASLLTPNGSPSLRGTNCYHSWCIYYITCLH